jgi:cytochrome c551/c552
MSAFRILRAAVLASLIVPAVGHAQSPPAAPIPQTPQPTPPSASQPTSPATPSATPSGAPEMSPTTRAAVDERIAKLRSQLVITELQMPLWSAFAQTMRDNAATTDALFARRAGAVSEMNAVDNMHSYAQIARAYADNTEHLATAFDSLYASLSDVQKRAADSLFRQQAIAAAKRQPRR